MVMKSKQLSMKKGKTVPGAGPSNVMMGRQYTGQQKPGVTSQEQSKSKGPVKGGTTKMFGKQTSKKQTPA